MISFKVVESILRVGPRKGQKGYGAVQKAPMKFSQEWLIDRIVRETSLSEGDVRNVFITLRNIVVEVDNPKRKDLNKKPKTPKP